MQALPFVSLLFYTTIIVCKSSASCPCHIPCTSKIEICTCYGPCGDDGYGCQVNGDDYNFLNQIMCQENQWIVQCIRQASCSPYNTLDTTNPYAAYELETQKHNILEHSFDDINDKTASFSWFGGNWFDFWGQNDAQFQSTHRTLQTSSAKFASKSATDNLGHTKAGYKIIALPLYVLIISIILSSLLGMLMCAGFVYCGLHYYPLLRVPPTLTLNMFQSLTLKFNGRYKSSDNDTDTCTIYRNMGDALHSPTSDETSSMLSVDEYIDSEDDNDNKNNDNNDHITRGNIENDKFDFRLDNKV